MISPVDTIVTTAIVGFLRQLRSKRGWVLLFITHDVSTVASLTNRVAVVYRGDIVERGTTDEILNRPRQLYTKVLVSHIPQPRIVWVEAAIARGKALEKAGDTALVD